MNKWNFNLLLLVFVLSLCNAASATLADSANPLDLVKETTEQVLSRIAEQREQLRNDPGKVYELVNELVLPRFDFEYMSQLVLGKYWARASDSQKTEFVLAFRELLVRTYATTLLNYADQEIMYMPLRMVAGATDATVDTRVVGEGRLRFRSIIAFTKSSESGKCMMSRLITSVLFHNIAQATLLTSNAIEWMDSSSRCKS